MRDLYSPHPFYNENIFLRDPPYLVIWASCSGPRLTNDEVLEVWLRYVVCADVAVGTAGRTVGSEKTTI